MHTSGDRVYPSSKTKRRRPLLNHFKPNHVSLHLRPLSYVAVFLSTLSPIQRTPLLVFPNASKTSSSPSLLLALRRVTQAPNSAYWSGTSTGPASPTLETRSKKDHLGGTITVIEGGARIRKAGFLDETQNSCEPLRISDLQKHQHMYCIGREDHVLGFPVGTRALPCPRAICSEIVNGQRSYRPER
jgi:hypothetical protein